MVKEYDCKMQGFIQFILKCASLSYYMITQVLLQTLRARLAEVGRALNS